MFKNILSSRNDALSPSEQLLLTLRFYATGSFLSVAGDFCGVHKSTACKTIKRVSHALASLRPQVIRMPETDEEKSDIKNRFFQIARFPMCIGAIDCSHVKIQSPGGDNAETFRNRKQYFSFNVQTISDPCLKILDIVARWPGASHDAHIFRNSAIMNSFETGRYRNCVIVGDSGYPIKPYLITPLRQPRNEAENLFNESQIRTRNVVERSYGVWKRRFPGLALGLRLKHTTTQYVIVSTAVLHNIAVDENEDVPVINAEEEAAVNLVNNNNREDVPEYFNRVEINNITRHNLIRNYFARL